MATWTVNPIGRDAAEILTPRVRYVIKADKTSFTLRAFEGRRVVERHFAKHVGHNYLLQGTDRRGMSARLSMNLTRKHMITRGIVGNRRFKLESKPYVHAALLVEELKKRRRIRLPLTHAFAERLHEDAQFRKQVYRHVRLGRLMLQPDWVDQACAVACTLCFLLDEPLSCVICSLCTDPDPILTA